MGDDGDNDGWWGVFKEWTDAANSSTPTWMQFKQTGNIYDTNAYSFVRDPYDPDWGRNIAPYTPIGASSSETIQYYLDEFSGQSETANLVGGGGSVGANSTATGLPGWEGVDAWDAAILNAQTAIYQKTGIFVPGNLIKAVMKLESNGENLDINRSLAVGPMQVTTNNWGGLGYDLFDPEENIMAGVEVLATMYKAGDLAGNPSWEWAARRYIGLGPGGDSYGTDHELYWTTIKSHWNALNTAVIYGPGHESGSTPVDIPNGDLFWAMTRGNPFPVTQEYGITDWSNGAGRWMYAYSSSLGWPDGNAHPGLDVGTPEGTNLYSPVAGTVEYAGPERGFTYNFQPDVPNSGGLFIRLENGDVLILGHMREITVKAGDQITAGQYVGLSGTANGDHVHVEYRRPNPAGGELSVDPRLALNGIFTGTYSNGGIFTKTQRITSSDNWLSFMKATATGAPVSGYTAMGPDSYHSFLARGVQKGWDFAAKQGVPGSNTIAYTWGVQFGQGNGWTNLADDIENGSAMTGD